MTISKVAFRYAMAALACAAGLLSLQSSGQAGSLLPQLGTSFALHTGVVASGYQTVGYWGDDDYRPRYRRFHERRFHIQPYPYRPRYRYGYGHGRFHIQPYPYRPHYRYDYRHGGYGGY